QCASRVPLTLGATPLDRPNERSINTEKNRDSGPIRRLPSVEADPTVTNAEREDQAMITKAILSSVIALAVGGALCDRAPAQSYAPYQTTPYPYQSQYPSQPQYAPAQQYAPPQQQYAPAQPVYA